MKTFNLPLLAILSLAPCFLTAQVTNNLQLPTSINSTGATPDLMITTDGKASFGVFAPSHPLQMASGAHCTAAGAWTNASDRRLKTDIAPIGLWA